ncbi:maternal effect protein oskar-like [Sitodiplosis mosellana]|uniref:maternal effect protein oskar-like n=1 Tax=Sitodiplosis mosellana TaxID=263140 RepID=UPI00244473AE|nr:maternal effect protein oskar-like [Sitodiplosis mosellana]
MTTETEAKNIIKSILNIRCRDGATIADIERDYHELTGEPLMDAYNFLNSIDCVFCIESSNSEPKWYVNSDSMEHIKKFILEQRQPQSTKPNRPPQKALNHSIKGNDCFFKDNIVYKHMRKYKQHQNSRHEDINNTSFSSFSSVSSHQYGSMQTPPKPSKPKLHAQFVGDDFFRLLTHEATDQDLNRKFGVQQAGLCVSGLSIPAAAKLIELTPSFKSNRLLLNVGSVDILHGHDLVEMCADFERLIRVCEQSGLTPIITTLAPLANTGHSPEMFEKLRHFNMFIVEKYFLKYEIIDIWSKMTNPRGATDFALFKTEPNYVSGSSRPHVLWSQTGRTFIRNHIKWSIGNMLKIKMDRVHIDA